MKTLNSLLRPGDWRAVVLINWCFILKKFEVGNCTIETNAQKVLDFEVEYLPTKPDQHPSPLQSYMDLV